MALRVTTTFTGMTGAPYLSVMNFAGADATAAASAATAVSTFWAAVDNAMSNVLAWSRGGEILQFDEIDGSPVQLHSVAPVAGVGALADNPLPFATQGLVQWRTGAFQDGREVRGRTFIPGLTENGNTTGALNSTLLAVLDPAADALAASIAVWSRPRLADPTAEPPITARDGSIIPATSGSVWAQFAVLRSRRD